MCPPQFCVKTKLLRQVPTLKYALPCGNNQKSLAERGDAFIIDYIIYSINRKYLYSFFVLPSMVCLVIGQLKVIIFSFIIPRAFIIQLRCVSEPVGIVLPIIQILATKLMQTSLGSAHEYFV